ncbi:hypothetical protein ACVHNB_18645 [Streptomyces sp. YJ-C3]
MTRSAQVGQVWVIGLAGRADARAAVEVTKRVEALNHEAPVAFDLSPVTHVQAAFLCFLRKVSTGRQVRVISPSARVREQLVPLVEQRDTALKIVADEAAAQPELM